MFDVMTVAAVMNSRPHWFGPTRQAEARAPLSRRRVITRAVGPLLLATVCLGIFLAGLSIAGS